MKKKFPSFTNQGFSLTELLLAMSIFMILATSTIGVILQGLSSNRLGEEQTVANQYASGGIEKMRSIKNQDFAKLVNSTGTGVVFSDGQGSDTATYYFTSWNDRDSWDDSNPSEMVDGSTNTVSNDNNDGHYVHLNANQYTSGGVGQITKVEVRAYFRNNWASDRTNRTIVISMTPYFNGSVAGNAYGPSPQNWSTVAWSNYYDITSDPNGPGTWSWTDIANLQMRATSVRPNSGRVYVARVEIKVTYGTTNPSGWILAGANNQFGPNNKFTRTLSVSDVQRDCELNIVESGGSIDPNTKLITSKVIWNFSPLRQNIVELKSYLTNWKSPIPNTGPIMMAYSKTTDIPYFRLWDGSSWGQESQAQAVGGNINYIVLKSSRTRNEAILGTLDNNGNLYVQVWDGFCWGVPTFISSRDGRYRSFDIAYEKNTDRAIITYLPDSSSRDPSYRIWDGSSWSPPVSVTFPPTTNTIRWIEMTQNPISTSDEIAMIMLDAGRDVYGMIWDGTNWGDMGDSATWETNSSTNSRKAISVAYEQVSGRAMFMWGYRDQNDSQYYRIWDGSSLTSPTLLVISAFRRRPEWMQLASRPNSNEIMYGASDSDRDLNTRKWSGSSWDTSSQHPEHDGSVETNSSMTFDIVWETHPSNPGKAWLMFGNGSTVSKKQWSGTTWGSATTLTESDDTSFIRLKADPVSGAIYAGMYENSGSSSDDIWESHLTGGSTTWNNKNIIWGGQTSGNPVYFRIDIATP